jgi:hypothetical protein
VLRGPFYLLLVTHPSPLRLIIARVFIHRQHGFIRGTFIEELQGLRHDLREISRFAFLFILIGLQTTFDEDQAALLEIFLADFAEASPGFNVDPLGRFFRLSVLILPVIAHSKAELSHFFACRGELALRVSTQTADQLNAV